MKLHKVLYFVDMIRYAQAGVAVTGARYRKRPLGPTCVPLLPTLREMESSGEISVNEVDYFGLRKKEYKALVQEDRGVLNAEEYALLDEVIDFVCAQNTAKTISDYSHQAPWERVEFGDEIPYSSAYLLFPSQVSPEAFDATEQGMKTVAATRPAKDSVVFADFGVFRRRLREAGDTGRL